MSLLDIREHIVSTRGGDRVVLCVTPAAPIIFGREDLRRMSAATGPSPRDTEILDRLRRRKQPADVFVFQSQALGGGPGCWKFDPELSDEEAEEMGYHIVRAHRFVHRGLVDAGINMAIGAAKGYRELAALRSGTQRFAQTLSREAEHLHGADRLVCEADLFLVRHLMVFTSLNVTSLVCGVIPDKLPLCERRAPKFRELRERARLVRRAG